MAKKGKFKYYKNDIKCIRVYENEEIPEGFVPGKIIRADVHPWNKGLTKDDPRVAKNAQHCHETRKKNDNYHAWNKGLTQETDSRVKANVEHRDATLLERYGVTNSSQLPHEAWNKGLNKDTDERVAKISKSRKGQKAWNKGIKTGPIDNLDDVNEKRFETMKERGKLGKNSFTEAEKIFYEKLLEKYSENDIEFQYFDADRYPFKCDFYIKSEDLFIELNGNWTHGKKPYNKDDVECQQILNEWKDKAQTSDYYKNAIYTWTNLDVRKRQTAIKNNLNIQFIYMN